ncbi:MAG: hypothetical protein QW514_08445 [Thermoprotei archaeon]
MAEPVNPATIALDALGVKVHNTGEGIRQVWKVKEGYLEIRFAVNIKTEQVVSSVDLSSERVDDCKRLKGLVKKAKK